jgi:hypothetical protein
VPIIAGIGVLIVLIVGYYFLAGNNGPQRTFAAVGASYQCDTLLTPGPSDTLPPPLPSITPAPATPSPAAAPASASPAASAAPGGSAAPSASAAPSTSAAPAQSAAPSEAASPSAATTPAPSPTLRLGFTTQVLGRNHVATGSTVDYGFCPPDSGNHYNEPPYGPIPAAVYPNTQPKAPGGWVHNLEHGWVVLLYRCTGPTDCPSDAEMQQLQAWYDQAPTPDPSINPGCTKEVLVARFDSMNTRFAVLGWGRELLTNDFDLDTALTFAQQWMDAGSEPEKTLC